MQSHAYFLGLYRTSCMVLPDMRSGPTGHHIWSGSLANLENVRVPDKRPGSGQTSGFQTVRILKICWTSGPDVMSVGALENRHGSA